MENKKRHILIIVYLFGPQHIAKQPQSPGPASGSEGHMDTVLSCAGATHLGPPFEIPLAWVLLIQQIT